MIVIVQPCRKNGQNKDTGKGIMFPLLFQNSNIEYYPSQKKMKLKMC
jgi:hypothetical protein